MAEISLQDATTMYKNSVVMYKGSPSYVVSLVGNIQVLIRDLETGVLKWVPFSLEDFRNVDSRMGYVNYDVFSVYMKRKPLRMYKVGLCAENISYVRGDFRYNDDDLGYIDRLRMGLTESNLADTLLGKFPSFGEVVEKVRNKTSRLLAFDRQFALSYKGGVYYRGKQVGTFDVQEKNSIEDVVMSEGYESFHSILTGTFKLGV